MLIGNVGKEPDVHYYDKDQAVAQFSLATTERGYKLQNGTQVPERTDWHNIVLLRGLAKIAEKYIHKGDKLYIEGRIRYRNTSDKYGRQRFITEIYAENLELFSSRCSSIRESITNEDFSANSKEGSDDEKKDDLPF